MRRMFYSVYIDFLDQPGLIFYYCSNVCLESTLIRFNLRLALKFLVPWYHAFKQNRHDPWGLDNTEIRERYYTWGMARTHCGQR